MGELPLPVVTAVDNTLILPVQFLATLLVVVTPGFALGQCPSSLAQTRHLTLQVTGTLNLRAVTECHVCPQTKVDAYGCTIVCLSVFSRLCVCSDDNIVFPERTALDGNRPDLALVWA